MPTWPSIRRPTRFALVVALLLTSVGLAPLVAEAGAPGAPPPAVHLALSVQLQSPLGNFSVTGSGVVNRTGDAQLSLTINGPKQHTVDVIHVDDTTYVRVDGGPYMSQSDAGSALPPGCAHAAGAANPQSLLGSGGSIQNLGPETIGGVTEEHIAVHGDLRAFLTQVAALVQQTAFACGVSPSALLGGIDLTSPEARRALAGASLDVDIYLEQPANFLRRIVVAIDAPAASTMLRLQIDATPLAAPVPIAAPGG